MHIKLTHAEAAEIVREHFNRHIALPPNVEWTTQNVIIEPAATADYSKKTVELTPLIRAIKNTTPFIGIGSPKIAAIKAVRSELESQGLFVGLADAKSFVEHFIP